MAVTGETQVEAQGRQIVVLTNQVERPRKPQPQLVAIERHAFDPLKHLREIDRRSTDFGGYLGECPAPRKIAGDHELHAIDEALLADAGAPGV